MKIISPLYRLRAFALASQGFKAKTERVLFDTHGQAT